MMLAAPEFIEAERIDLLDEIKVAAELQHRMLANGVMRGEEGSEFKACHGFLSGRLLLLIGLFFASYVQESSKAIAESSERSMVVVQTWLAYRRQEFSQQSPPQ